MVLRNRILVLLALLFCAVGVGADDCGSWGLNDAASELGLDFQHRNGARGDKHLPETMGAGIAWLDANGDGRVDLYVMQSGNFPPDGGDASANVLFLQTSKRTFVRSSDAPIADRGYGQGVVAADYDGDGDTDLYLCNFGADRLLANDGQGNFEDVTDQAGIAIDGWSSSAAFADADGDGDLDLFVVRYLEYDANHDLYCGDPMDNSPRYCDPTLFDGATDRFYRNLGDGRFEDATTEAGLGGSQGKGLGVLFVDLNGDHHPDLYVANDLTPNGLFLNDGAGHFEDAGLYSGAAFNIDGKAEAGMGLAAADFDADGDLDLTVTNFDVETNTLYRNVGDGFFEDHASTTGFGPPSFNLLGFGAVWRDLNNDGYVDYYATNGHIFETPNRADLTHAQSDLLLLGDATGRYRTARCGSAFDQRFVGRGLAAADFDDDGDWDLAVANNNGPLQLLRNDQPLAAAVALEPNPASGATLMIRDASGERIVPMLLGDSYQSSSQPLWLVSWPDNNKPHTLAVRWADGQEDAWDMALFSRGRWQLQPGASPQFVGRDRGRSIGMIGLVLPLLLLVLILIIERGFRRA